MRLDVMLAYLKELPWHTFPLLFTISLASWLVESKKWQYLVRDVKLLRFRESVNQNLTSQAASFITPLRAGEFALKVMCFDRSLRRTVFNRVLLGNLSQMFVTVVLGMTGLGFYLSDELDSYLFILFGLGLAAAIILTGYLWLHKKWNFKTLKSAQWWKITGYSALRYGIFSSNWIIILLLLKYDAAFGTLLINISIIYLAVSIIPIFQLVDVPVKWTVAAFVFEGNVQQSDLIILATTVIWMANSIFPTLLGCALLPFQKLKTKTT